MYDWLSYLRQSYPGLYNQAGPMQGSWSAPTGAARFLGMPFNLQGAPFSFNGMVGQNYFTPTPALPRPNINAGQPQAQMPVTSSAPAAAPAPATYTGPGGQAVDPLALGYFPGANR